MKKRIFSPPPDYDHLDRRKSRRDMSPLQKSYVYGTTIEKKYGYEVSLKVNTYSKIWMFININNIKYVAAVRTNSIYNKC